MLDETSYSSVVICFVWYVNKIKKRFIKKLFRNNFFISHRQAYCHIRLVSGKVSGHKNERHTRQNAQKPEGTKYEHNIHHEADKCSELEPSKKRRSSNVPLREIIKKNTIETNTKHLHSVVWMHQSNASNEATDVLFSVIVTGRNSTMKRCMHEDNQCARFCSGVPQGATNP